jgi:hypothetical protein
MSSALLEQQQALLEALWARRREDAFAALDAGEHVDSTRGNWRRGLQAYRSNGQELARKALAGAYPVVLQLLGEENFHALAASLWQRYPPDRGDVACWGGELPALIGSLPDLAAQEPYLADVARCEWLLHEAACADDVVADTASFRMLVERPPERLTLRVGPGAGCVASRFPVASIINAHLGERPSLEQAGQRLRDGVPEAAVVWRQGLAPRLREAMAGEPAFLGALQERCSLADSLQAAPDLDFSQWLAPAVQSGLLVGVAET